MRDEAIELTHLGVISLEDLEEARLRAGGALHAPAGQCRDAMVDVREVELSGAEVSFVRTPDGSVLLGDADTVALLGRLAGAGMSFAQTVSLYDFDGERGYSLGQGE